MKSKSNFPAVISNKGDDGIELFLNAFDESNLLFYASDLLPEMGLSDLSELNGGLRRTYVICESLHIPVSRNLKMVYRDDHSQLFCDWKISKLAHYLLMINGTPNNPKVGQAQLEIYKKFNVNVKE